ncbi:MAG TPA: CARDB domain-containing protein [Bacteroidales bacterium]|nr:CARDB domain-containing protein [Bacteroidales bacterium]
MKRTAVGFGPGSFYFGQVLVDIPKNITGSYYFFIHTDYKNEVFEYLLDTNNVTRTTGTSLVLAPDLMPSGLMAPAINNDGRGMEVNWDINNLGPGNLVNQGWLERVYLSATPIYQAGYADIVGSLQIPATPIAAGGSLLVTDSLYLPMNLGEGTYFLHVASDDNFQVFEGGNEANNVLSTAVPLTIVRPDLVVSQVGTPDTAWSGLPVTLSWYDKNTGASAATGTWKDRVYLSSAATYSPATVTYLGDVTFSGSIPAGDSVLRTGNVVLPNGITGNFYIAIHADHNTKLAEGGRDGNNITLSTQPMLIRLSPFADLRPDTIFHPDTVLAGTFNDLGFRVINNGSIPASGGSWTDRLLIGTSSNPALGTTYNMGTFTRTLPLEPDSTYQWMNGYQIPANLTNGQYYVIGKTDEFDMVFEHIGEANNFLGSRLYVKSYPIDLAVTSASAASDTLNSGESLSVNWSVRNISIVKTLASNWEDGIYLSADTLLGSGDILLDKQKIFGPVQPGNTYTRSMVVNVPWGVSGNYYLLVKADRDNDNKDVVPGNNVRACKDQGGAYVVIRINQLPTPDLIVSALVTPTQAYSGQAFKVKWTVTNQGPGTVQTYRVDQIYLSEDFTLGQGDPLLLSRSTTVPLATGASYTDSAMVTTTVNTSANYVIICRTDGSNHIYEVAGENNNTAMNFIAVSVPPPADLIVAGIDVADTLIVGFPGPFAYTVTNIGTNAAAGAITDAFYLSQDTILDNGDLLIHTWSGSLSLAPGASVLRNQSPMVPGVAEGLYYLIAATDAKLTINETNNDNNYGVSDPVYISLNMLPMEVWVDTTLDNLEYLYWRIDIPDTLIGETVLIELKGDSLTGNNEIFYARNRVPSKIDWDRRQSFFFRGNQELVIPEVFAGKHYLMVTGLSTTYATQNIRLRARKVNFELRHYDPKEGGNTGTVTMQLDGSKFTPDMEVWLVNDTMPLPMIKSLPINLIDGSKAYATLVLNVDDFEGDYGRTPLTPGLYDLYLVKPGVDTLIVEEGFEVVAGTGPVLLLNIQHPPSVRANRYFTMAIQYANGGNIDVIAPKAILMSKGGAPIALQMADLALDFKDLELHFTDPEGPPGILRPGALYTYTIYSKSTDRLLFKLLKVE